MMMRRISLALLKNKFLFFFEFFVFFSHAHTHWSLSLCALLQWSGPPPSSPQKVVGQQKKYAIAKRKKQKRVIHRQRSLSRVKVVALLFKEAKKNSRARFITLSRALMLEKMTVSSLSSFHAMGGGGSGGSADDPYLLQSLKGGHRNNAITSLAFAPQSKRYIFSASTGDGSIMFWHVGGERSGGGGRGAYALLKNRKRPVRFLGHERDVLALAHTEREGEGGRVASAGLDRSVRVWKATAYVFVRFFLFLSYFFFCSCVLFVDQRSSFFFCADLLRRGFRLTKYLSSLIPLQTQQGRKVGGFEIGALGCDSFVAIQR